MEQHRIDRLKRHQREHTLIRGAWTKTDDQGRELACLLFALAPEVGPNGDISACPSSVLPSWLAHLTPWMDDAPSDEAWEGLITRYAELASRWHVLDEEDWRRLDYAVRGVCLKEAMQHTQDEETLGVCRHVLDLCDREAQGKHVDTKTWSEARTAARAREVAASRNAELAAWAAAAVTWAAMQATQVAAAANAARAATWAAAVAAAANAARAAVQTAAARAAKAAAAEAARAAATDRVVTAILDTIEQSVNQKS